MKSPITSHVLDLALGQPAQGIPATLEYEQTPGQWTQLAQGMTNEDGRIVDWLPPGSTAQKGIYRITFDTGAYQNRTQSKPGFYPYIPIVFEIRSPEQHYHVPLLLSPHGYSTYRGS
jgi:5-hydroxyisourate hydrolase